MKRPEKILTSNEMLEILNKQWATKRDIQYLAYVGENKAGDMAKEITKIIEDKGYRLPRGLFPMSVVKDYLKIDINYLKKMERS